MTEPASADRDSGPIASAATDRGGVDVVIVNWNSGAMLGACVGSLVAADHARVRSVIVVDNGSVDGSDRVHGDTLPLDVVRTGANLGFGRASNVGAAKGTAEYILLLNPDAEVDPDAIDRAAGWLGSPEAADVGVVGIMLTDRDGTAHRHCARFPRWTSFIGNSLGLTRLLSGWFPPITMVDFDHLSSRDVDHVMGAFYMIRRSLYEELGGFDERFFVYLEDLDLSYRVAQAGHRIRYLADATAFHHQGGTSERVKAHRLFYSLSSGIIYAFKHFPRAQAIALTAVTLAVEPVSRSGRAILRVSVEELWFTWRGFAMLYRATPRLLRTAWAVARARR